MYFERKAYLKELISAEGNGMIKIITGIRRCGKSFLLFNIFCKHLLERGVLPKNHINGNFQLSPLTLPGYLPLQSHPANRHESCFSLPCHPIGRWWSSRSLSCCRESPFCDGSRWCGQQRW